MALDEFERLTRLIVGRVAEAIDVAPQLVATVQELLPGEGLAHLLGGRLLVTPALLESELRAALGPRVGLTGLECGAAGLRLELEVAAWHGLARLALSGVLTVESVTVDDQEQRATARWRRTGVEGRNLVGALAAGLVRLRPSGPVGPPSGPAWLAPGAPLAVRQDPQDPARIEINLSRHPVVQRLREAGFAGQPLLRRLRVVGCRHAPEGLLLRGEVSLGPA